MTLNPPSATPNGSPSWQAALAQHERWLRTILFARLRDVDQVNEVMQEVAVCLARQSAPLRDEQKAAPWLYRIALRQAMLWRRRTGRRQRVVRALAVDRGLEEGGTDPLDWLLADERRRLVREALAQLRSRDAEILLLKYTEQWSYSQIAERLGVSTSAVEARLHRARQRLRTQLAVHQLEGIRP